MTFCTEIDRLQTFSLDIDDIPVKDLEPYLEKEYGSSFSRILGDIEIESVVFN